MENMIDVVQSIVAAGIVAIPIVVLVAGGGINLERGLPLRYREPAARRGIQEEDAPRWRVELAHRRQPSANEPRPETAPRVAQGCGVAPAT